MGPNDKKPLVFQQAKARQQQTTTTATERMDERKSKQIVDVAAGEARMRPDSSTVKGGLLAAMAFEETIKIYRQAVTVLRASIEGKLTAGTKGFVKDAAARLEELRQLKAIAEEDVSLEPNKTQPSLGKLSDMAEAIVRESKKPPPRR